MNANLSLMVMIAATIPLDNILEKIKESAAELSIFPEDEDKRNNLRAHCMMFLLHLDTKGNLEGATELINEIESKERKLSIFDLENLS